MNDKAKICVDSQEDTLRSMANNFYSRKMLSIAILVWINFLVFFALAVFSILKLFKTDQIKYQIIYAAVFVCCIQLATLTKIFAWQMIHKNLIKDEIKRLEFRIVELAKALKTK
jgi:hypothetical protein